jgi:hypothetical protein
MELQKIKVSEDGYMYREFLGCFYFINLDGIGKIFYTDGNRHLRAFYNMSLTLELW